MLNLENDQKHLLYLKHDCREQENNFLTSKITLAL